jgi:uncharacterized protein (TIGR03437 family)
MLRTKATVQSGLNLGLPYSVTNYPTSLNPATDSLRNITGKVNSDGTVTIYGITSTVSSNGDAGAVPYPTMLGGTTVSIIDAGGRTTAAPLLYASSTQVNFLVPANVATGIEECLSPPAARP